VRVDKWLGDGVMLVGVEVEPVVAAVVAICNQLRDVGELPMRAGIATGPVIILEGDDYVGKSVNTAARLCDRADAGMILAATDSLVLPEWVEAEGCPPLHVRGLADPVSVVLLSTIDGAGPHPTALAPATAIMSVVDGLVRPLRALKRP
jgi:class 3 adenylate cyclase